ncbi:MAG: hypothetical protein K5840_02340, partial [Eubacterium sp.]|nr:hypothetical protein [Eubacterium sp.]
MGKDAIKSKFQTSLIKLGTFSYINIQNKDKYNFPQSRFKDIRERQDTSGKKQDTHEKGQDTYEN